MLHFLLWRLCLDSIRIRHLIRLRLSIRIWDIYSLDLLGLDRYFSRIGWLFNDRDIIWVLLWVISMRWIHKSLNFSLTLLLRLVWLLSVILVLDLIKVHRCLPVLIIADHAFLRRLIPFLSHWLVLSILLSIGGHIIDSPEHGILLQGSSRELRLLVRALAPLHGALAPPVFVNLLEFIHLLISLSLLEDHGVATRWGHCLDYGLGA